MDKKKILLSSFFPAHRNSVMHTDAKHCERLPRMEKTDKLNGMSHDTPWSAIGSQLGGRSGPLPRLHGGCTFLPRRAATL